MYYIAKIVQAAGLGILLFAFLTRFPELMSYKALTAGLLTFLLGWITQRFLLKHRT
jgi:hypothetical protein